MPEQDPSGMPVLGDRPVLLQDVTAAYAVFLGRRSDDPKRDADWLGVSLSELVAAFVGSPEFVGIRQALVKENRLAERHILSASELARADQWLSGVTSDHRLLPGAEWGDLLLAAVTSPDLVALADPGIKGEALTILRRHVEDRRETRASVLALADFDPSTFLADPVNRRYRNATGGLDFDAKIAPDSPLPILLPLFTEGLAEIRKPGPTTLGDWLDQTQTAATRGLLTHWLWDEATYLRNRSMTDDVPVQHDQAATAFLDFVTVGDQAGVSPHPLFCPHAYRILNGSSAIDPPAFRHFVKQGDAAGLRTSALFDPDFYLARQPLVREQIADGRFTSALEHLVRVGLEAGYAFSPDFDRSHYLALYPDVAESVAEGSLPSAEWHYVFHGAREGRAPNPFFHPRYYADRYPLIGEEMRRLGIATTLEHYLLLGSQRGWRANRPLADRPVAAEDGKALFEKRSRRAFCEVMDGVIDIPSAETPRLSVIIPVSGQADFTAGALKSAAFALETLKARRGIETEIIVVDNGSTDHTNELLAALPAVRVERFAEPIGFPAAVNAGAKIARGDLLLVINNDIEFAPDAFDRIVAQLDADPSVGVVGAKIILPNETLQEVGSMLDGLGSSHGLGRGADASSPRGVRQVEVHYASACFIGFRREDFEALAGFSEAFSPGYFEDVDFSLRMKRDLGKRTVVDTALAVIHYENASFAKGRPSGVSTALILRNRLRLKTAHAPFFQTLDPGRPRRRAALARSVMSGPTRLLVIVDRLPAAAPSELDPTRPRAIVEAFSELGIPFDMLALKPSRLVDGYQNPRVRIFLGWMLGQSIDDVLRHHGGDYTHLWISGTSNLSALAPHLAWAKSEYDLSVICDTWPLSSSRTLEEMRLRGRQVSDELGLTLLADELAEALSIDLWITGDAHHRGLVEQIGLGPVVDIGRATKSRDDAVADLTPESGASDIADRIRAVLEHRSTQPVVGS